jgi:hypothetical protein
MPLFSGRLKFTSTPGIRPVLLWNTGVTYQTTRHHKPQHATNLHYQTSDPTRGQYINGKFILLNQLTNFDYMWLQKLHSYSYIIHYRGIICMFIMRYPGRRYEETLLGTNMAQCFRHGGRPCYTASLACSRGLGHGYRTDHLGQLTTWSPRSNCCELVSQIGTCPPQWHGLSIFSSSSSSPFYFRT